MKRFYSLLLGIFLLMAQLVHAQQKTVSGKVTDARDGSALPGVTVKVKGSNVGTLTSPEGDFKLNLPDGAKTLVLTYVGYADQEVVLTGQSNINVSLSTGNKELSEVVVIGYGTQSRKEVTGSISKVSGSQFETQPLPTFETALQGRTTGVYISGGSGKLGQAANIKVRGISSVNAGQQPLYVVDGVPIVSTSIGSATSDGEPDNPLAAIDPNEIESIDVLKDAASASIYGARGANGVILITTKRGKVGATKINFGAATGFSRPTHKQKFLNASQYRELFTEAATNSGVNIEEEFAANTGTDDWNKNFDTDWANAGLRNGTYNEYTLSINGGDEKTRFYISGVYNNQKGILVGNDQKRYGGRINIDHNISSRAKVGANLNLMRTSGNRIVPDNGFDNPIQLNALSPLQPLRDDQGRYNSSTLYYNNLINLTDGRNLMWSYQAISNIFLSFDILPGLTFKTDYGFNYQNLEEEEYFGRRTQIGGGKGGYGFNNQAKSISQIWSNTLNFVKDFNEKHNLGVLVGIFYDDNTQRNNFVQAENFPNDRFQKIANASKITGGTSFETGRANVSYISRINYKFLNRYLLQANVNVNGSSRFGYFDRKYRYGIFPGVQLGWIVTEEDFLKNSKVLSFLKVRAGYGRTGNDNIGNFDSRKLFGSINYGERIGILPVQLAAEDLRWEKMDEVNVGLDFGFIGDRINGTIDVYNRKTQDMLLDLNLPATGGYQKLRRNIGAMRNRGVELGINSKNLVGEFKWNSNFTITVNRNKVLDMAGTTIEPGTRSLGRIAEGGAFGYFYGKKFAGVDPQNGDALYYDAAGKTTNDWAAAADQKIGDPNPDFYGGLGNNFSFKSFYLDVQTQFVYGNDIFNQAGFFQSASADYFDNQTIDQLNRWQKPGDVTNVPQARLYGGNGTKKSSRWVQNGSFLRVKSVSFGYNVPKKFLSDLKIASARVYVSANNLFTITDYTGYDPEVNTSYLGDTQLGHDFYTPPQAKTVIFGVNVGF